jgi:DNA repair photolyase
LPTSLTEDRAKSALSYNESPDLGFDRSINPYRGCEHGCIYCYARPSHAYLGMSPGLDFESRILLKPDAARVLRIPGTKNFKDTPPHDVVLMHLSEPVAFDDFAALMGPLIDVKKPYAPTWK